ncbi:MAG: type II toxin-antitoxin system HicB family antitoxin [Bryobacteraceae bacterium]
MTRDEDGYYVASVPQIPGCHTQARSLDELVWPIREALERRTTPLSSPPKRS